jgi:UDP:flavonoid glycosyltransferase YjiC (YdhE family)
VTFLFYISGHGFGHASRDIEIINALAQLVPDFRVVLRTAVPEWFLKASLAVPVEILSGDTDTGVVQPDSLSIDETATAQRAALFYAGFDERVAREVDLIRSLRPSLVTGDIPPLAFAAASAAGVPSVAVSNFTWDWIYGGFPGFDAIAPGVRAIITSANALATRTLRLPFAGGFASMQSIEDVPLVARRATLPLGDTRRRLGLPGDRPIVLATFGGHGGNIPLERAADDHRVLVVATDYEVGPRREPHPNLRVVSGDDLRRHGATYTDLLAAADVVATKLGYGIVSECLANGVALLYTLRGRFIEQDVFMREMPAMMRSLHIDTDDLREGRWAESIEALLAQPMPARPPGADGAIVIAERMMEMVDRAGA